MREGKAAADFRLLFVLRFGVVPRDVVEKAAPVADFGRLGPGGSTGSQDVKKETERIKMASMSRISEV